MPRKGRRNERLYMSAASGQFEGVIAQVHLARKFATIQSDGEVRRVFLHAYLMLQRLNFKALHENT